MERLIRKDTLGGVLLIAAAGFFLANARGLEFGTFDMMGPGLVPVALSVTLLMLGVVLLIKGIADAGGEHMHLPRTVLRAVSLIFVAIIAFVLLLEPVGYVLSTAVLIFVAGLASPETRLRETAIVATLLAISSAVVFVELLGVPMPLWPAVLS